MSLSLGIGLGLTHQANSFLPSHLFKFGDLGVDYRMWELDQMFQANNKDTAVSAVGDPVGLVMDYSQNMGLGTELVTNGTFDTDTDWTKGTGWTISGGAATHGGGVFGILTQTMATTTGSVYLITADLTYISGGGIQFFENGIVGETFSSSTSIQKVFVATANNSAIGFGSGSGNWSVDNISVKQILGYHATQPTAAARPTLAQDDNLNYYVDYDEIDDALVTTLPDLGTDATAITVTLGEMIIEEGLTIGAGDYTHPDLPTVGRFMIDRALDYPEMNQLIAYYKQHSNINYGVIRDRMNVICLNAVDVKVYDTSKDSDQGAWRTGALAQASSWYSETLNTATRGATAGFPAVAVVVAEAAKVTIYDGDDPDLPMWMVISGGGDKFFNTAGSGAVTAVSMRNGWLVGTSSTRAYSRLNFISEESYIGVGTATYKVTAPIAVFRNATVFPTYTVTGSLFSIVNQNANDVAMTVLAGAPIDPLTGIETPTIAVATDGGVSVITDGGDVWDVSLKSGAYEANFVTFRDDEALVFIQSYSVTSSSRVSVFHDPLIADVAYTAADETYDWTSPPSIGGSENSDDHVLHSMADNGRAFAGSNNEPNTPPRLTLLDEDTTTPANGMVSYITSTYNTGWMHGDIKGAWLSSTDDTDLVGSSINDDFTGYADQAAATAAGYSFANSVTFDAATDAAVWSGTGEGQFQFDVASGFANGANLIVEVVVSGATKGSLVMQNNFVSVSRLDGGGNINTLAGTYSFALTKNGGLRFASAGTFDGQIDNISVRLADADRSVNNNGLATYGTVTKTAVADGAELMAYSGFSGSNHFIQPYNADLDFGTGDLFVTGWATNTYAGASTKFIFTREDLASAGVGITLSRSGGSGDLGWIDCSTPCPTDGAWFHWAGLRRGGVTEIYLNGVLKDTGASLGDLSNTSAVFIVGASWALGNAWSGDLALLRISATAPSAEQIAKIYNDELPLFQENAACTLYGASDAVTALAHDPDTDLLHVGTSAGRSVFDGLERKYNTTDAVTTVIDVSGGLVLEK